MNFLVKAAVVAAVLGASAAASAEQFDFSYTFADGQPVGQNQQITGSFTGTAGTDAGGGLDVTNISNIQMSFNGVAFRWRRYAADPERLERLPAERHGQR